jgi:predicted ribonuclease YlaK
VLVVDTNIIVTPGEVIAQLIESQRWTLIIPLAVITELDGLRRNDSELGRHAERAIRLLETRIRTHAKFVKVQTSRGNYLSDLSCRSEDIDFAWQGQGAGAAVREEDAADTKSVAARNVDEVILRILAWQRDNFVDRRNLLQPTAARKHDEPATRIDSAHKSVLLTLDRNLRLKAKSRGLPSVDSRAAAALLELP